MVRLLAELDLALRRLLEELVEQVAQLALPAAEARASFCSSFLPLFS